MRIGARLRSLQLPVALIYSRERIFWKSVLELLKVLVVQASSLNIEEQAYYVTSPLAPHRRTKKKKLIMIDSSFIIRNKALQYHHPYSMTLSNQRRGPSYYNKNCAIIKSRKRLVTLSFAYLWLRSIELIKNYKIRFTFESCVTQTIYIHPRPSNWPGS